MNNLGHSIVLKNRSKGLPALQDFLLEADAVPEPGSGGVLTRTLNVALTPNEASHLA
jgi:NADPH-dependent curcumin reductase CurA